MICLMSLPAPRQEVVSRLSSLGLSRAWLALQIGESKQNVHNWLKETEPVEPQDPAVWEKMLDALGLGTAKAPEPAWRETALDLALAVLQGDQKEASQLAPRLVREIVKTYQSNQE